MSAPAFAGLVRTALSLFPFDTVAIANWQRSLASGLQALFILTGVKGTTELTIASPSKAELRVDLRSTA